MNPTVLVMTTVHAPDDTRIRERLIRTLSQTWDVMYGAPLPGPTDISGLSWLPLSGGRLNVVSKPSGLFCGRSGMLRLFMILS